MHFILDTAKIRVLSLEVSNWPFLPGLLVLPVSSSKKNIYPERHMFSWRVSSFVKNNDNLNNDNNYFKIIIYFCKKKDFMIFYFLNLLYS